MKYIYILFFMLIHLYAGSQSLPLLFDFENPPNFLPQFWTVHPNLSGVNGRVEIYNDPSTGNYAALLSKVNDSGGLTQSAIDLKLNTLSWAGREVDFSFDFRYFFDETQYYDAIFMSDNGGISFTRVIALQPSRWCENSWMSFPVFDFNALLVNNGLSYSANFIIRFSHEGTGDFNTAGDEDGLLIDNIRFAVRQQLQPAAPPVAENFSSGTLNPAYWRVIRSIPDATNQVLPAGITPTYRAEVVNADAADTDGYSFALGKLYDCGGENNSYIDLHINLQGFENQHLLFSFAFKHYFDETQVGDAILFSDDGGLNFVRAIALDPDRWNNYQYGWFQPFVLSEMLEQLDLDYSEHFVIRFQQLGTGDFNTVGDEDGMFLDDVRVWALPTVEYKRPPFCDDFENSDFDSHWRFGTATLDPVSRQAINGTNPAHFAARSLTWGVNNSVGLALGNRYDNDNDEFTLTRADLHLDFSAINDPVLSFSIRNYYNELQAEDGLYLSVDGGSTFTKIYTFNWSSLTNNAYTTISLPLDQVAGNYQLDLSSSSVLRFQTYGTGDFNTVGDEDGIILDNLCINGVIVADESPASDQSIRLWPNPVAEQLQLALPFAGQLIIQLTDVQGREVFRREVQAAESVYTLDVRSLPAGLYWLQLRHPQGVLYHKLVKQ